jgi:hypothetical protein
MSATTMVHEETHFPDRRRLYAGICQDFADRLADIIKKRRKASLALAGGTTPGPLYESLSNVPINWEKVSLTLTDERWVSPEDPASNEYLIRDTLMRRRAAVATFVLFYLMTVFALSWGTAQLHYARKDFLAMQMVGVIFFAIGIPVSALAADRLGSRTVLIGATVLIFLFGLAFEPLFVGGSIAGTTAFLALGFLLMGFTYGPLGTALAGLFPTAVRYTGASLAFNFAGIIGASLAPSIATWLATNHGVAYVGYYLAGAAGATLLALLAISPAGTVGGDYDDRR